jgi:23S rRNA (uracil1939-C5)-methyltransferase
LCLFARRPREAAGHAKSLADGEKEYVALVRGITSAKGVVNRPLLDGTREQQARTRYRRLAVTAGHSLVAVRPDQGRKHQIRRHFASIGHPVIGDHRYGHVQTNRYFEERYGLDRTFLHCRTIRLAGPAEVPQLESPLPGELESTLERMRERPNRV